MGRRTIYRTLAVALAAVLGAVLLSGSDQPVTAQSYSHWQQLPPPPLSPRVDALGVAVGPRVLVLGGHSAGGSRLRDGAAYHVPTGAWSRFRMPLTVTDRDTAVEAAGVVVLRHLRPGRQPSWWRYDVRRDVWTRMPDLPPRLSTPSAFRSEVYALSGRRVVVYSVRMCRWTALPPDPRGPALVHPTVTASRHGTVVTGHLPGHVHRIIEDRWDGLRWHRTRVPWVAVATAAPDGATRVRMGGRTLVVRDGEAWIRLP